MPATGNAAGWTPEARAGIETDRLDWLDLPAPAAPVADPSTAGAKPRGRLSAGLYDPIGMAAGLSLRLLALEPVMLPGETQGQPFVLEKRALAAMRRIAPAGMVREFEPVQYLEPHSALKVHPLHGGDTVAVIDIPNHRMERLEAEVRNLCPENSGIEVAIGCAPRAATPEEIAAALSRPDALPRRYTLGAWTLVAPHANVRLAVQVTGASRGQDRMLVLTRLPAGAGEGFAHLVVDKIAAWPAQAIF